MAYNNKFSNFNGNPYFTRFDLDNYNQIFYNMNQPNTPGWTYPNQYNQCPQCYDQKFQNNSNSSQSQWGFTSPGSIFQPTCPPYPPCPQFSQYSFPDFASYTPFLDHEEKSELEKGMEPMQEAEQKFQASPIP